jgi:hypothetical protein
VVDGKIVPFVHFEEMESRMADMPSAMGHHEVEEANRAWYSGAYGDEGVRTKVCSSDSLYVAPTNTFQTTFKEEDDDDYDMV